MQMAETCNEKVGNIDFSLIRTEYVVSLMCESNGTLFELTSHSCGMYACVGMCPGKRNTNAHF